MTVWTAGLAAAVSLTCRPERSTRLAPVARSRASNCRETAGGLTCGASAAATLPCAATACSMPSLRGIGHAVVLLSLYGR